MHGYLYRDCCWIHLIQQQWCLTPADSVPIMAPLTDMHADPMRFNSAYEAERFFDSSVREETELLMVEGLQLW